MRCKDFGNPPKVDQFFGRVHPPLVFCQRILLRDSLEHVHQMKFCHGVEENASSSTERLFHTLVTVIFAAGGNF
jgi:hypothetical protein